VGAKFPVRGADSASRTNPEKMREVVVLADSEKIRDNPSRDPVGIEKKSRDGSYQETNGSE
jgi:hypothetical protein